jgi:peptide/nickel transport system permease protein
MDTSAAALPGLKEFKKQSQAKEIWRRFRKGKGAVAGLALLAVIVLVLACADLLVPYAKATQPDFTAMLQGPSLRHLMGTDEFGRDLFARIIYGGRTSLTIAFLATLSSCVVGSALGAVAGYFGGRIDNWIMRPLDIFMSIPDILFTMAVVFALGAGFINLLLALTLAYFTNYVRLVRSQVLNLSDLEYIEAARAGGSGDLRIIVSHILPNAIGVISVNTTLNVAKIILYESTLSFLGLGMPPPAPEWGLLLSDAREYMRTAPHLMIFPALAIVLSACSVNLIGDGLRDALDPHLKS